MLTNADKINELLKAHQKDFYPLVKYNSKTDFLQLDFTAANHHLTASLLQDTALFTQYINETLASANAIYGIGGYFEHRTVYARSSHFGTDESEARRLHLGLDIWAPQGTAVYNFMNAKVHSFGFNQNFGDYGATIILQYQLGGFSFYGLYGHLSLKDIQKLTEGQEIPKGKIIGHMGSFEENGYWPPHVHFQLICDMQDNKGDFPGVVRFTDKQHWLAKTPNPNLVFFF
jgi:murein DD-endopeptidase MepM/ murein hydrolase activator NlpD